MPKKNKLKQRSRPGSFLTNNLGEAQIFRNSFAVFDGADPQISLKYMKDMFKEKLDEDVITMIFSECAYDVDQALETLISLASDSNTGLDPEEESLNSFTSKEIEYTQEEPNSISDLNMNKISKHLDRKHFLGAIENVPTLYHSNFSPHVHKFSNSSFTPEPIPNKEIMEDCTDSAHKFYGTKEYRGCNNFPLYSSITSQSPIAEHCKQIEYHRFSSPPYSCSKQNVISNSDPSGNVSSMGQLYNDPPKFITPMMPMSMSLQLCSKPMISYRSLPSPQVGQTFFSEQSVRNIHSTAQTPSKYNDNKEKIIEKIKAGKKLLIILRGLPGSGKSTLGQQLRYAGVLYSSDDYFVKNGLYKYDLQKLSDAHEWNKARAKNALEKGITPIIIDNTNVEAWEFAPYVHMALRFEYEVHILEPNTPWKFNPKELSRKNKHNVGKEKIRQMMERFEHGVTVDTITKHFGPQNDVQCEEKLGLEEQNISTSVVTKNKDFDSTDDHSENISQPNSKNNFIKLEVDVHQEDSFESFELKHNNLPDSKLHTQIKSLNGMESDENIDDLSNDHKITDLNELRALIQEDSEESQSISIHTSTSDSTQDVSGWEAITEHDDDFLWSTTPVNSITKKTNQSEIEAKSNNDDREIQFSNTKNSETEIPYNDKSSSVEIVNSINPCFKSIAHNNLKEVNSFLDPMPLKNDMVSGNEQIKSAHELFGNDCARKYSSGASSSDSQQLKTSLKADPSVLTWGEWGVLETSKEKSVSSKIQNASDDSSNSFLNSKDKSISDVNCIAPKPQRNMRGSTVPLKNLFNFKQEDSSVEEPKEIDWDTKASDDSWNKPSELNNEIFSVDDTSSMKPNSQESVKIIETDHLNSDKVEGNTKNISSHSNETSLKNNKIKKPNNNLQQLLRSSLQNITNDWQFPPYVTSETKDLEERVNEKEFYSQSSIDTQTEPSDFILLHKVKTEENFLTEFLVLTSRLQETTSSDSQMFPSYDMPQFPSFEKSTCTDDLPCDRELSQKFQHLQEVFPDIADEDLNHLLEMCHGDDDWLSNLLLEWGYKYNVQKSEYLLLESSPFYKLLNKINQTNSDTSSEDNEQSGNSAILSNSENPQAPENNNSSDSSSSESSFTNSGCISKLHLSLNTAFALQLEELFGPVGDTSCTPTIEIDLDLARLIHDKWSETVRQNAGPISLKKNEASGFVESNYCHGNYKSEVHHLDESEPKTDPKASEAPLPLSEIMDMEYALELHKKEKMKLDSNLVTKLKRQELYNMFPGCDTIALDEIFESNNYSLKNSVVALGDDIGYPDSWKKEKATERDENTTKETKGKFEGKTSDLNINNTLLDFVKNDWSSWVSQEEEKDFDVNKFDINTISSEAARFREDAALHYNLRQECIHKAQEAYFKGMKEVASFYTQKGNVHGLKFKELNKTAASLIVQGRNVNTSNLSLDLHGLYVKEAITTLQRFLKDKKMEFKRHRINCPCTLSIITGQGIHSDGGAKLRPSIMEFLKKTGYRFSEITMGVLEVTLMPNHLN